MLTLPILPLLRSCFPDAHIAMLLKRYTGDIVEGNPYLNELLWYDDENGPVPLSRMRREISARKFDAAVVVYPRFRLAWLIARSGIPLRIGTGYRYYSLLFNKRVYEHRRLGEKHELEYNMTLLQQLGCGLSGGPEFVIDIPAEARRKAKDLIKKSGDRPVVIIHPGSGGSAREWPASKFGELAKRMVNEDNVSLMVTGAGSDAAAVNAVVEASGGRAISLLGKLTVKELAALLEASSLFVGNSTGPIHIAAAMGTPVVGLYPQHTAMSVRRWGPWTPDKQLFVPLKPVDCRECEGLPGSPCACMESIAVEPVLSGARELLRLRRTRKPDARETGAMTA
ncbi:MAG: glycosyltransferase family 9 protein [Ignavibacteria bacterium]|nr:glycosyltransferase family 9 protein [Ignavibacteria bacterium]